MRPKYIYPWTPQPLKMKALCSFEMLKNMNTASHPRRPDSSTNLLYKPQLSQNNSLSFSIIRLHNSRAKYEIKLTRETWGPHSGVAEDSSLLGCDAVSLGEYLLMLWGIIVPSPPGSSSFSWSDWPCRQRYHDPSKHQEQHAQQHSVTPQTNWEF
jgi:hypothetical protein